MSSEVKKDDVYHEFSFSPIKQIGKFDLEIINAVNGNIIDLFSMEVIEHVANECIPCKNSFSGRKRKPDVDRSGGKRRLLSSRLSCSTSSSGSCNEEQNQNRTILESVSAEEEEDLQTVNEISELGGGGVNLPISSDEFSVSADALIPGTSKELEPTYLEYEGEEVTFSPQTFQELNEVLDEVDIQEYTWPDFESVEDLNDLLHRQVVPDGSTLTPSSSPMTSSILEFVPQLEDRNFKRRRHGVRRGPVITLTPVYKSRNPNDDSIWIFAFVVLIIAIFYYLLFSS